MLALWLESTTMPSPDQPGPLGQDVAPRPEPEACDPEGLGGGLVIACVPVDGLET